MKVRLLIVAASAVLLLAPRTANALGPENQPAGATPGGALMQNANESAQATTDMSLGQAWQRTDTDAQGVQNVSYGGVAAGQSQAGGRHERLCGAGPQCKVYFGQ